MVIHVSLCRTFGHTASQDSLCVLPLLYFTHTPPLDALQTPHSESNTHQLQTANPTPHRNAHYGSSSSWCSTPLHRMLLRYPTVCHKRTLPQQRRRWGYKWIWQQGRVALCADCHLCAYTDFIALVCVQYGYYCGFLR